MLCPNCQQEFNAQDNLPRILIFCGHTFCHQCIDKLLKDAASENPESVNTLKCPECQTPNQATDGVNSFPKNLVLLQVNNNHTSQTNPLQQVKEQKNKESFQKSQPQTQSKVVCQVHNKKLEAFCEKDLQVLCIDCILSDQHKSHEIISVQKAVEKQKQFLYEEVSNAQKTEDKLKFIQNDIKRHINEIHQQADKNRKELSQIYNYVRELILEREQTLKRQISENLIKEEQECELKLQEINEFMILIQSLKSETVQQTSESDLDVLIKAKQRVALGYDVNGHKSKEVSAFNIQSLQSQSQSLAEIKRDQELTQISKIIHPTFKGNTNIGSNLNQAGNTLYSHTQSTAGKLKRGTTTVNPHSNGLILQSQGSNKEGLQQANSKEEIKKPTKSSVKTKVSPHRQSQKKNDYMMLGKKQGVVVLDQNNKKQNSSKINGKQGHVMQQQINLYNYNLQSTDPNFNQSNEISDIDITGTHGNGMLGGDDVSSIYPMETNECYFQYSPRSKNLQNQMQIVKRNESDGNFNELLESLNKSDHNGHNLQVVVQDQNREQSSTASETGGSNSDCTNNNINKQQQKNLKQIKSNIETPKAQKINPWLAQRQKSRSNKKGLKKDNSISDFEEFKNQQIKISTPNVMNGIYRGAVEESKNQRVGSLQRFNSNSLIQVYNDEQQSSPLKKKLPEFYQSNDYENTQPLSNEKGSRLLQSNGQNRRQQLASLSQERSKRKAIKMANCTSSPNKHSPFAQRIDNSEKSIERGQDREQLMVMLSECSKNIEKLEFRTSAKKLTKLEGIEEESPIKETHQKPSVCLVDLTKNDNQFDNNGQSPPLRLLSDEKALIKEELENEDNFLKNVPNPSQQMEYSAFNQVMQSQELMQFVEYREDNSSNVKQQDNLDHMIQQFQQREDSSNMTMKSQYTDSGNNFLQQNVSVSVDTSISDPFRALCRVKEEFIFVFSGFNEQKLMTCEALDVQRGVWKQIGEISKARTKFSAVPISKSRILLFGGKLADGQRTGEIEEYNIKTNKFKTLPFKLPKPRSGFAACVKREEGKIFFCGGNSGSVLKKFDCLDLKKGKWSRWPEMIQKRDELAVALGPDGKIYAIGGYGGGSSSSSNVNNGITTSQDQSQQNTQEKQSSSSNCLRTSERFDFATGQWEMLPEMNEARRALAAVALPDGIYAIGGYDGKQYLSSVEKFDLQKQKWITVKSMNTSRCTLSAVASSDCQYIYVLGGFNGNSLDLVERYNIMTDEWEFITPMISKRFMHEAVCLVTH